MHFEITSNIHVVRDSDGLVRHISHTNSPFIVDRPDITHNEIAEEYLHSLKEIYNLDEFMLINLKQNPTAMPDDSNVQLRFASDNSIFETTVFQYVQTINGIPIWEAGFTMNVLNNPIRITSSYSTIHNNVTLEKYDKSKLTNINSITNELLSEYLGFEVRKGESANTLPRINKKRLIIYQYDSEKRYDPHLKSVERSYVCGPPPTLNLPSVANSIKNGKYYIVLEVLFTLDMPDNKGLNWRAFIEPHTISILYLRALTSGAGGQFYEIDPYRQGAPQSVTPNSTNDILNQYRTPTTLPGLPPPIGGLQTMDSLQNEFVRLEDIDPPNISPPTRPSPYDFTADALDPDFAATNAYYHSDWIFRYVRELDPSEFSNLFDGTIFPVRVDHRGFSDQANAKAPMNSSGDGSDGFRFGIAAANTTLSITSDPGVVYHEFSHALLEDVVHSPYISFAHSCGDSFAAILNDVYSLYSDRFLTFPWIPSASDRRHDRLPSSGWAWGGSFDDKFYYSEQILSTTLFRIYRAIGGDSQDTLQKSNSADMMMYLIIKATSALGYLPIQAEIFATALMNADINTSIWRANVGGAYHKVIRWSFEKQGMYQPPGSIPPYWNSGDPPPVDVYINDGRSGEYHYQPKWWENQNVWNRRLPDAGTAHQNPIINTLNYLYVRIQNRGRNTATNVIVKAFDCRPSTGLIWPQDWQPLLTQFINAPDIPGSGGEIIIGPFNWVPTQGHECLLVYVNAEGDISNAETVYGPGPIPEWRLVPNDNNIAQRNVVAVPGMLGSVSIQDFMNNAIFWVNNPFNQVSQFQVNVILPNFMVQLGWRIEFTNPGGAVINLDPGSSLKITIECIGGVPFGPDQISDDRMITFHVTGTPANSTIAGGIRIGGMSYYVDPNLAP